LKTITKNVALIHEEILVLSNQHFHFYTVTFKTTEVVYAIRIGKVPQSLKHSNISPQKATSGTIEQAKQSPKIVGFISVYGEEISFAVRQTVRDLCDGKIGRLKSDFAQRSI